MNTHDKRRMLLTQLVRLEAPLEQVCGELRQFAWDSAVEEVTLYREDAVAILEQFMRGVVSANAVAEWAEAIEGREDIGLDGANELILKEFIFEVANPAINVPLDMQRAGWWLGRLRR